MALPQRAAAAAPAGPSAAAVAALITGAGMREVPDAYGNPLHSVFRGTGRQYQEAINALCRVAWVGHMPGLPDIGMAWCAFTASEVLPLLPPFGTPART